MNKYIKTDIENGIIQMRIGICNALHEVLRNNVERINLGFNISYSLILKCLEILNLKINSYLEDNKIDVILYLDKLQIKHNFYTGETILEKI